MYLSSHSLRRPGQPNKVRHSLCCITCEEKSNLTEKLLCVLNKHQVIFDAKIFSDQILNMGTNLVYIFKEKERSAEKNLQHDQMTPVLLLF